MQALASFLATALGGLVAWLAKRVSLGVARTIAYLAAYTSLLLGLSMFLKALVAVLTLTVSNQWLIMGFYICWPDNAPYCFSAVIAADISIFVYKIHMERLRAVLASIQRIGA